MLESRHFGALLRLAQAAYAVHLETGSEEWLWDAWDAAEDARHYADLVYSEYGTRRAVRQHWRACKKFAVACVIICGKRWEEVGCE